MTKTAAGENIRILKPRNNVAGVVAMPTRNRLHSSGVLNMPNRSRRQSNVVTLIARSDSATRAREKTSPLQAGARVLSLGVRMTLVALFALLGWPHPTRDNDPGPSAARPSHWELISLISRLHLPSARSEAAAASISSSPSNAEISAYDEAGLARAA